MKKNKYSVLTTWEKDVLLCIYKHGIVHETVYKTFQITNLMHNSFIFQQYVRGLEL